MLRSTGGYLSKRRSLPGRPDRSSAVPHMPARDKTHGFPFAKSNTETAEKDFLARARLGATTHDPAFETRTAVYISGDGSL